MLATVRIKLSRGEAALAFARTNPSSDPSVTLLVEQLGAAIAEGETLVQSRGEADNQARISRGQRDALRTRLRRGLLRALSQAGLVAAEATPAIEEEFRPLNPRLTEIEFGAAARSLAEAARQHLEKLGPFGVTPTMVDQTDDLIAQLDQLVSRTNDGRRARSQARVEVNRVGKTVLTLVNRLDALYRHQFAGRSDLEQAWVLAIGSAGPIRRNGKHPAVPPVEGERVVPEVVPSVTPASAEPGSDSQAA